MENNTVIVYTDGGSRGNPGEAAVGVVIKNHKSETLKSYGEAIGIATNNVAEYSAFLLALETILAEESVNRGETEILFLADSLLAVKQLSGEFKVKNPNLATYVAKIKNAENLFKKVTYQHIPREQNKLADSEVNKALDQELFKQA